MDLEVVDKISKVATSKASKEDGTEEVVDGAIKEEVEDGTSNKEVVVDGGLGAIAARRRRQRAAQNARWHADQAALRRLQALEAQWQQGAANNPPANGNPPADGNGNPPPANEVGGPQPIHQPIHQPMEAAGPQPMAIQWLQLQ